ncbi:anthranilate phosphoribosyltransferase [Clostridium beijerinckii]|nr:anthranilate phosphoribosyltransferase [Clostridium beijerinckii]
MIINDSIKKLALREELTEDEVRGVINQIMKGEATSAQIGGFLVALE